MLLDSNVIIYSIRPEYGFLDAYIEAVGVSVSAITQLEVLGYHGLRAEDKQRFERLFEDVLVIPIDARIIEQAITLRQRRRMGLADSLVAATAQSRGLTLVTRNVADFRWVDGLALINPFEAVS
jgi:predicted nucleic acid-binding protein